jgi:hypothetical protein
MKNIHILPTDKPSRLVKFFTNKFHLCKEILPTQDEEQYQNIYITSDEEIKEGEYGLSKLGEIIKFHSGYDYRYYAKVILTTDQDLIKDGVQAIDDEFLEWFVKNPSCEFVRLKDSKIAKDHIWDGTNDGEIIWEKEIIIPQEEPKQETLEEAAEKWYDSTEENKGFPKIKAFKDGAKWQQERMYSDIELFTEELKDKIDSFEYSVNQNSYISDYIKEWFEQFKK